MATGHHDEKGTRAAGPLGRVGRHLLVGLTVALFFFGAQIASWSDEANRLFKFWSLVDAVALLLDITILGAVLAGAACFLDRSRQRWLKAFGRFAFLAILAVGLAATVSACFDASDGTIAHQGRRACSWPAVVGWTVVLCALFFGRDRLTPYAVKLCLIFSPIVPIIFVQLGTWSTFNKSPAALDPAVAFGPAASSGDRPQGERESAPEMSGRGPVLFFVFDEWSFVRSADDRGFREFLPNLRRLSGETIAFSHARSPGPETFASLPRLLYQGPGDLRLAEGQLVWDCEGRVAPADSAPTLFEVAAGHGYKTAMVGSFLHFFTAMMGEKVDFYRGPGAAAPLPQGASRCAERAKTLAYSMAAAVARNGRYAADPLSSQLEDAVRPTLSWACYQRTLRCRDQAMSVIDHCPPNTFAFFHFPFPHDPFVFNPDGSFSGLAPAGAASQTPENYQRHLCYLDRLIGEIVDRLRAAGKYDSATIILTSDHSWRFDPDPAMLEQALANHRVPLVVKLPGQRRGVWVDDPFETVSIGPLLVLAMKGQAELPQALALIRDLSHGKGSGGRFAQRESGDYR